MGRACLACLVLKLAMHLVAWCYALQLSLCALARICRDGVCWSCGGGFLSCMLGAGAVTSGEPLRTKPPTIYTYSEPQDADVSGGRASAADR